MKQRMPRLASLLCSSGLAVLLAGCGSAPLKPTNTGVASLAGVMHGGQQPLAGATIQLYAMGTTGDGSASTPLLNPTVTTDANGGFSLTNAFTCPSPTAQVYLVGTGGNPGLAAGTNNTAISLMAALGQCNTLTSTRYISVNELTTIGSVVALAPFMSSYSAIGSGTSDSAALTNAVALVSEYTDAASGSVPGPSLPAGYYASSTQINTLGNVVGTCVNSFGGQAGDDTLCGQLFSLAQPGMNPAPADIIGAILDIVNNPTHNSAALYNLVGPVAPFQPTIPAAPAAWTFPILPPAATPVISPGSGTYSSAQTVTISDTTPGATIYYTLDGSVPTTASAVYSTGLNIAYTQTVTALATASGYMPSATASASFVLSPSAVAPTFSPAGGSYNLYTNVTIASTTSGATIYYTTDGSVPSATNGTLYAGPVLVQSSETIKAVAIAGGVFNSSVAAAAYTINSQPLITSVSTYRALTNPTAVSAPASSCTYPYAGLYVSDANGVTTTPNSTVSWGAQKWVISGGSIATGPATDFVVCSGINLWFSQQGYLYQVTNLTANGLLKMPTGTTGLAFDSKGYMYYADGNVTSNAAPIYIAGTGTGGDGGPALTASMNAVAIAIGSDDTIYVADQLNKSIRKFKAGGTISSIATGLTKPWGVTVDSQNNVYFADNNSVKRVDTFGNITTIAGTGVASSTGDGSVATLATLNDPRAIALDSSNNLYIAEYAGNRIRKVTYRGSQTPAPVFSIASGSIPSGTAITFVNPTSATIYCTTDGSVPTVSSPNCSAGLTYTYPHAPVTINAVAYDPGFAISPVSSASYTFIPIQEATPVFSVPLWNDGAGSYRTTVTDGVSSIAYTLDGSTPTAANCCWTAFSPTYMTIPVPFSPPVTVKAYRIGAPDGKSDSATVTFTLSFQKSYIAIQGNQPGTYSSAAVLTLDDSGDAHAVIFYTTDGSTPTHASQSSSAPYIQLVVQGNVTLKAFAGAPNGSNYIYEDSDVITAHYTTYGAPFSPSLSPSSSATYHAPVTVTITAPSVGPKIYYTTDGSTPTPSSTLYTAPFTITQTTVVKTVTYGPTIGTSNLVTATYTISP